MTDRASIYGRNSKSKAKSIAEQLKLGREAVAEHGWTLAGEYSEGGSASRYAVKARDEWARLLADLGAGALDILVLWEASRGSREPVDWFGMLALCRARGVRIHIVSDERTFDPRKSRDARDLGMAGVDSAYESDKIKERVRRGVREAAAAGGVHGRAPFGYVRVYDERTGERDKERGQIVGPDAPLVREIFKRLSRSTPLGELERDFIARGLLSPTGKTWRRNTIREIATNIAYIGQREHVTYDDQRQPISREVHKASWPALVDEGTFWAVQQMLNDPRRRPAPGSDRPGAVKYLLSHLATAPCGRPLKNMGGILPGHTERYTCSGHGCTSIARPDADEVVERIVLGRLSSPDVRKLFTVDTSAARTARAEAARYRGQLEEARRSYEGPDGISAETMARKERSLKPLIEDADRRGRPAGRSQAGKLAAARNVRKQWDEWPLAYRREVIEELAVITFAFPSRRLTRHATHEERLAEAVQRLGGSRWVGDDRTWGELALDVEDGPVAGLASDPPDSVPDLA